MDPRFYVFDEVEQCWGLREPDAFEPSEDAHEFCRDAKYMSWKCDCPDCGETHFMELDSGYTTTQKPDDFSEENSVFVDESGTMKRNNPSGPEFMKIE